MLLIARLCRISILPVIFRRNSYRIDVALSLSNVNADFLQLILCMMVSHCIIGDPLYGAALFLMSNIWLLYFRGNLQQLHFSGRSASNILMWLLLSISVFAGLALVFVYPSLIRVPKTNLVSFFVLLVAARTLLSWKINSALNRPGLGNRIFKGLFQLLFLIPCLLFAWFIQCGTPVGWIIVGGYALTGFLLSYQSSTFASLEKFVASSHKDILSDIFSYRVFSNMSLYAQIALSLGVLVYVCYVSFTTPVFDFTTYLETGIWIVAVLLLSEFFSVQMRRRGRAFGLNLFIFGAAMWIAGSLLMAHFTGFVESIVWACVWGLGLACITSVLDSYNNNFRLVAHIADRKISNMELRFRSMIRQIIAVVFSNAIMLFLVTIWVFVIPSARYPHPELFRVIMVQLPVLFMIVSMFFALRQPLDERSLQKLRNYTRGTNRNFSTKQNLRSSLVEKKRVKFGVKILAFFVRPVLHLKVIGTENMSVEQFPSVFVCNHGIIYGPVAAVIYLPTYFRPWIDRKMVDRAKASEEMYSRFVYRLPLPRKAKIKISRMLSYPVTWALNSFNPIPVERNHLRNVMSTFEDTVRVLTEGDNVLIFPEKPHKVKRGNKFTVEHCTDTVGTFFTGFASIASLYHAETGKCLRFYPLYASKKHHTFSIGEPVVFDPSNDPREEKQRIAEQLHDRMYSLSEK